MYTIFTKRAILWGLGTLLLKGSKYIVPYTWSTRWYSRFCLWKFLFYVEQNCLTKPSWVLIVNVCKPSMKHIWYGVVFNSKYEYERLVKVDFRNIQNFQLQHLFSCSSDNVTIYYCNCFFLSRSDFFEFFLFVLPRDKFPYFENVCIN